MVFPHKTVYNYYQIKEKKNRVVLSEKIAREKEKREWKDWQIRERDRERELMKAINAGEPKNYEKSWDFSFYFSKFLIFFFLFSTIDSSARLDPLFPTCLREERGREADWGTSYSWPGQSRKHHQCLHHQNHRPRESVRDLRLCADSPAAVVFPVGGAGLLTHPRCQ